MIYRHTGSRIALSRLWVRPNFSAIASLPAVVFLAAVFVVPMALVLMQSLGNPGDYGAVFTNEVIRKSFTATIQMAIAVTFICCVISYPYAYILARCGRVLQVILLVALLCSFWTSLLVRTYAWQIILNDTGIINSFLMGIHLVNSPIHMIRTPFAVYIGMTQVLAPFCIMPLFAQLRAMDPDVERSSQSLGATNSATFLRVTLPLSLPGVAAGGLLVFILALGFYITPQLLGGGATLYIGSVIVQQVELLLDLQMAATIAVVLTVFVLVCLWLLSRYFSIGKLLGISGSKE